MHLDEAQTLAWSQQAEPPRTSREALARAVETLQSALAAFDEERLVQAQTLLENSLPQVLIALKALGIVAESGMGRSLARMKQQTEQRAFYVYGDRVEVWAGGECRGQWPLYSEEDYRNLTRLAVELGCPVVHTDSRQLELFQ